MNCEKCGTEVKVGGDKGEGTMYYETVDPLLDSNKTKYPIPFWCDLCGAIKFPMRPLGDKVFIVSDPVATHLGESKLLVIPDEWKAKKRRTGTVVAIGKGYYDNKGKFYPTSIKVGQRVSYHMGVPWSMDVEGQDNKKHRVEYMGERDIQMVLDGDFDETTIE